jgi:uncharacterized protein DUF5333
MRMILTLAVFLGLTTGAALAKSDLWQYPRISQGLFDLAVADTIRKRCPTISARMFRGIWFAQSLYDYAEKQNYTRAEVKAFVKSDVEKSKLRKRVVAHFIENGVDIEDPKSFCPMGEAEIAKKSQVGKLLRRK